MASKTTTRAPRYWLFKSEADCYSIDHLAAEKNQTTFWDGVRNYQARNMLRDEIQPGDGVFFYHSNSDPLAIVGICEVTRGGYPDHTAFDPNEKHYDPKSRLDSPTWYMVDVKLKEKFDRPVTRDDLKATPELAGMAVMQKGSRLSVTPVTAAEWKTICRIGQGRSTKAKS